MPKIEIKKEQSWMGTVFRIYIDGMYMGTSATMAAAKEAAKHLLPAYDRIKDKRVRWRPASR